MSGRKAYIANEVLVPMPPVMEHRAHLHIVGDDERGPDVDPLPLPDDADDRAVLDLIESAISRRRDSLYLYDD